MCWMRITFPLLTAALALFLALTPSALAWDTNVYTLNLSGRGVLKDAFDAGLRPIRRNETYQAYVEDKFIRFTLGGTQDVTLFVEQCRFRSFSSNQTFADVQAETPYLSLEEARAWMLPVCRKFGRSEKELDDFLTLVRNGHRSFGWIGDDGQPSFVLRTPPAPAESDRARLGIRFQSHRSDRLRPLRIVLMIEWERPYPRDYSSPPLRPPKGYETFSMEPVPYIPSWVRHREPVPSTVQQEYGMEGAKRLREQYARESGNPELATPSERPLQPPWIR